MARGLHSFIKARVDIRQAERKQRKHMDNLKMGAAVIRTSASAGQLCFLSCPLYFDVLPFQAVVLFSLADQRQFVSELNVTSIFPQVRCLNQFRSFLSNTEMLEKYLVSQV